MSDLCQMMNEIREENKKLHKLVKTLTKNVTTLNKDFNDLKKNLNPSTNTTSVAEEEKDDKEDKDNDDEEDEVDDDDENGDFGDDVIIQQDTVKVKENAKREKALILGVPATAGGGKKEEHKKKEDPKKKEESKKKDKECWFCKGKGHTEKFCWKRYPSKAPPGCREKEKEELMKKYDWAREVVIATEKKQYYKPIREAIEDDEERKRGREENKNLKCPNCKRWGHKEKDCWLLYPHKAPAWWEASIALRQKEEWESREERKGRYGRKPETKKKEEKIKKVYNINL